MVWSVGEVARQAGISVRTLHHYDEVGLVVPTVRTAAGHRRYDHPDLRRLQRVLAYRELGFRLDQIATLLDDETTPPVERLLRQHAAVSARIEHLQRVAAAIEKTMEAHRMGIRLTPQEMLDVFGDFDPLEQADEAQERWGDTDAYQQSQVRTSSYTKDDWLRLTAEGDAVLAGFAAAFAAGQPATGDEATAAAEAHRLHISRWFYDCSYEMHRGLAEMYVADERFTAYYERVATGLAHYVHDAVHANADRAGS